MEQTLLQFSPVLIGLLSNRLVAFAKWSQALPFWKDQDGRLRTLLTVLVVGGTVLSAALDGSLEQLAQSPEATGAIEMVVKVVFSWALAHVTHKASKGL